MPRYYNPEKEELEKRIKQIEAEVKGESTLASHRYTGNLKERWRANNQTTKMTPYSNYRLVVITALLFIVAYLLLFS